MNRFNIIHCVIARNEAISRKKCLEIASFLAMTKSSLVFELIN